MSKELKEKDAYEDFALENNKLDAPEVESARSRKWRIFKTKAIQLQASAQQGAIMGGLVGSGFGFFIGCWSALQMKKLYVIPVSMVVSGASFGFFMACGTMIRSDDERMSVESIAVVDNRQYNINNLWMLKYNNL